MPESFLMEGIVEIEGANAVWMDPVKVLSNSYSDYKVSRSRYYLRSTLDGRHFPAAPAPKESTDQNKSSRKRKRKKFYLPNEKEIRAELRHQKSRSTILTAHTSFLATVYPKICSSASIDICSKSQCTERADLSTSTEIVAEKCEVDFLQLAKVFQAPLYELNINGRPFQIGAGEDALHDGVEELVSHSYQLFNTFIEHENGEAIAECAGVKFLLPRCCRFLISDFTQARQLIPDNTRSGYNLIVIDPPWENKSVHRKSLYPTIPNRQLLSFPMKRLVHTEGALVALWLTNREKLHQFVEKELFPAWGVEFAATWYWLKLSSSGNMISTLDLQHHKPYECLLLGYLLAENQEATFTGSTQEEDSSKVRVIGSNSPPDKFVVMSIPGDHSRKPPMGSLLAKYAPGPQPVKGLELFARELNSGWTSWGNEPLRFQNLKYFQHTFENAMEFDSH